jgi:hypothetical protein
MADQCSNCFFSFTAPTSANKHGADLAGKLFCNRKVPDARNQNVNGWLWPEVSSDWWCGDGADRTTGLSYGDGISGVPGTGGAGPGYLATSTTSVAIASSGSISLTTQVNLAYTPGARVRATSSGSGAWMEGVVTSYSASGILVFTADLSSGSGSHTDWDINIAGQPGVVTTGIASKGTFTCGATRPVTVADAAVVANSIVLLMAANVDAAKCVSGQSVTGKGIFHITASNVAGVSFTVDTGDSSSFTGAEIFEYVIVNP